MKKYFDFGSMFVIITTFILFALALFTKGLTHDILLEAGILLVSIKLILMNYKTNIFYQSIHEELREIKNTLESKTNDVMKTGI